MKNFYIVFQKDAEEQYEKAVEYVKAVEKYLDSIEKE